ncbi:MAG: hypothetical protein KBA06_03720 [Saprospiraceae bacterium]|nr:hypothetical protein [Saprospiraceae bacterium]
MLKKLIFITSIFLLTITNGSSKPYFNFSPSAQKAYQFAISLRFKEARTELNLLKQKEPENLITLFISDYIDFFTIFINENKDEFKQLSPNKDFRLNQLQKSNLKSSPYFRYCQAEILLHWALTRLKFEEYYTAFTEVKKAHALLKENEKLFPDFIANKKSLGILHAIVGTIPDSYKWGVTLVSGIDGDIALGKKEIESVINYSAKNEFIFYDETIVMYALLLLHLENQGDDAWNIVKNSKLSPKSNPLSCFVLANLAMHTGKNDEAIEILSNRPTGNQYHPFWYLDFMLGNCKLYRLDNDAEIYLLRYIKNFKGLNYIKEAYQKLAWHALLNGKSVNYQSYMKLCTLRGNKQIEGDKKAYNEAITKQVPEINLLKARLLFDGGYYKRSLATIENKSIESFKTKKFQLEYMYRKGRIYHKLRQDANAIECYQYTINNGKTEKYYFACNAALQMGILYEQQKKNDLAKSYFTQCLNIEPEEYANGLHQQAKAGLNRLK